MVQIVQKAISIPLIAYKKTYKHKLSFNNIIIFQYHEFLVKGEPPPECIPCNCPLTINHLLVLIECAYFNDVRQRFYQVPSLQDLFKTVKPEVILDFLKAAAQAFRACELLELEELVIT